MRVPRGAPPLLTRRRVTTAVAVLASGGLVTVAMAAGPVVYSEYTQGGERESRLALPDGAGDVRLPKTTAAAAVSPDGRRIAQVGGTRSIRKDRVYGSWLRVTAADGSSPVTVVEERAARAGQPPRRVIGGRPVWSPDGTQVLVQVTNLDGDGDSEDYGRTDRLRCVVDTRTCTPAGVLSDGTSAAGFTTDVVAWQATQGPLRREDPSSESTTVRVRCGARAGRVPAAEASVVAIDPAGGFGPPLRLRGVREPFGSAIDPRSAGIAAVADGTVAFDLGRATVVGGRVRCTRRSATYRLRSRLGVPRLRLRAGGADIPLPTPPGLRSGDGLALVALGDGGALLLTRPSPTRPTGDVFCGRGGRTRECFPDVAYDSSDDRPFAQRLWRLSPGARAFVPVTTASRAALRTLKGAGTLAPADGGAVLAVDDERIERVTLDGQAPTVVARGARLSLALGDAADGVDVDVEDSYSLLEHR